MGRSDPVCALDYIRNVERERAAKRQSLAAKIQHRNKEQARPHAHQSEVARSAEERYHEEPRGSSNDEPKGNRAAALRRVAASERIEGLQRHAARRSPVKASPKRGWTIDDRGRHVPILDWEEKRASKGVSMRSQPCDAAKPTKQRNNKPAKSPTDAPSCADHGLQQQTLPLGDSNVSWTLQEVSPIIKASETSLVSLPVEGNIQIEFDERFVALQTSTDSQCDSRGQTTSMEHQTAHKQATSAHYSCQEGDHAWANETNSPVRSSAHSEQTFLDGATPCLPCADTTRRSTPTPQLINEDDLAFSPTMPRVISHSFDQIPSDLSALPQSPPARQLPPSTITPATQLKACSAKTGGYSRPGPGSLHEKNSTGKNSAGIDLSCSMPSVLCLDQLGQEASSGCAVNLSGEFQRHATRGSGAGLESSGSGCARSVGTRGDSEQQLRSWLEEVEQLEASQSRTKHVPWRVDVQRSGGASQLPTDSGDAHGCDDDSEGLEQAMTQLLQLLERRQQLDRELDACLRQVLGRTDVQRRLKDCPSDPKLRALAVAGRASKNGMPGLGMHGPELSAWANDAVAAAASISKDGGDRHQETGDAAGVVRRKLLEGCLNFSAHGFHIFDLCLQAPHVFLSRREHQD